MVQKWLCRGCGFRFSGAEQGSVPELQIKENIVLQSVKKLDSRPDLAQVPVSHSGFSAKKTLNDSPFPFCEDVGSHESPHGSTTGKSINAFASTTVNTKYASGKKAKNLVKVETQIEKPSVGGTKADIKGKIVEYTWWMQKQGYSKAAIQLNRTALKVLTDKGSNILNPESFKEVIARQSWSESRKRNFINAYNLFVKLNGLEWTKPRCHVSQKFPFIPSEAEIDTLTSGTGKKLAAFLQLLKETAMSVEKLRDLNG